jgi:DNA-binding response OmpR family regulator
MELKILTIEDQEDVRKQIVKYFNDENIENNIIKMFEAEDFNEGIKKIKENDFDLVILDLCKGIPKEDAEKPGYEVLKEIRNYAFIPVIFYSGLTHKLNEISSNIVGVVNKGDGLEKLKEEISRILRTKLGIIKKKIYEHIRLSLRDYFWESVHKEKEIFNKITDEVSLGYLILRRIANSLSKEKIKVILNDDKINHEKTHPVEFYIYPIRNGEYEAGEILLKDNIYYIILTPSCDFVEGTGRPRKVGKVLLAVASELTDNEFYKKYVANKEKYKQSLCELIECRKSDRYFFLPQTPFIKNLVLDFQNKIMVNFEELQTYSRIAKLDSPFAESMLSSFIRFYNRVGFPDIDTEFVLSNIDN